MPFLQVGKHSRLSASWGPNWGPPLNPSSIQKCCCDGLRVFIGFRGALKCRETAISQTFIRMIAVFFISLGNRENDSRFYLKTHPFWQQNMLHAFIWRPIYLKHVNKTMIGYLWYGYLWYVWYGYLWYVNMGQFVVDVWCVFYASSYVGQDTY